MKSNFKINGLNKLAVSKGKDNGVRFGIAINTKRGTFAMQLKASAGVIVMFESGEMSQQDLLTSVLKKSKRFLALENPEVSVLQTPINVKDQATKRNYNCSIVVSA